MSLSQNLVSDLIDKLIPSATALGFALFLATNACAMWGGVFPFMPHQFQTPETLRIFFEAQSLSCALFYLLTIALTYRFSYLSHKLLLPCTVGVSFVGWWLIIIALYLPQQAEAIMYTSGILLGIGFAGFLMLFMRIFASLENAEASRTLLLGSIYAAPLYFSLHLFPSVVVAFLIPLFFLPLFTLSVILGMRPLAQSQMTYHEVPQKSPDAYFKIFSEYHKSMLALSALALCTGITRSTLITDVTSGLIINIWSMSSILIVALIIFVILQKQSVSISVTKSFKIYFPVIMAGFFILPFIHQSAYLVFGGLLYALYSCTVILMIMQATQGVRERGLSPLFLYGIMCLAVYGVHDIGFLAGSVIQQMGESFGVNLPLMPVSFFSLFFLAMIYFVTTLRVNPDKTASAQVADKIELASLSTIEQAPIEIKDRISKQCLMLQQTYQLSLREVEVIDLIARGNTVAKIAESLVLSENTVRTHMRRIYAKLGIHKKQELLDLMNEDTPASPTP